MKDVNSSQRFVDCYFLPEYSFFTEEKCSETPKLTEEKCSETPKLTEEKCSEVLKFTEEKCILGVENSENTAYKGYYEKKSYK